VSRVFGVGGITQFGIALYVNLVIVDLLAGDPEPNVVKDKISYVRHRRKAARLS
jgi:hypothetical protein